VALPNPATKPILSRAQTNLQRQKQIHKPAAKSTMATNPSLNPLSNDNNKIKSNPQPSLAASNSTTVKPKASPHYHLQFHKNHKPSHHSPLLQFSPLPSPPMPISSRSPAAAISTPHARTCIPLSLRQKEKKE
jgi:hypothetical protein